MHLTYKSHNTYLPSIITCVKSDMHLNLVRVATLNTHSWNDTLIPSVDWIVRVSWNIRNSGSWLHIQIIKPAIGLWTPEKCLPPIIIELMHVYVYRCINFFSLKEHVNLADECAWRLRRDEIKFNKFNIDALFKVTTEIAHLYIYTLIGEHSSELDILYFTTITTPYWMKLLLASTVEVTFQRFSSRNKKLQKRGLAWSTKKILQLTVSPTHS